LKRRVRKPKGIDTDAPEDCKVKLECEPSLPTAPQTPQKHLPTAPQTPQQNVQADVMAAASDIMQIVTYINNQMERTPPKKRSLNANVRNTVAEKMFSLSTDCRNAITGRMSSTATDRNIAATGMYSSADSRNASDRNIAATGMYSSADSRNAPDRNIAATGMYSSGDSRNVSDRNIAAAGMYSSADSRNASDRNIAAAGMYSSADSRNASDRNIAATGMYSSADSRNTSSAKMYCMSPKENIYSPKHLFPSTYLPPLPNLAKSSSPLTTYELSVPFDESLIFQLAQSVSTGKPFDFHSKTIEEFLQIETEPW
jgi:hypothetical protein